MDTQELANALFGASRVETTSPNTIGTVQGVAVSDSENGKVKVKLLNAESVPEDGETEDNTVVELQTTPSVQIGDVVTVTTAGGILKKMAVTGNAGSGDKQQTDTKEAAKVATNYIDIDNNNGITVGNMTEETLGHNTYINSDGVSIRDGETVLASFGDDEIDLAQTTNSAAINMCNNRFKFSYDETNGSVISTGNRTAIDPANTAITIKPGYAAGTMAAAETGLTIKPTATVIKNHERNGTTSVRYVTTENSTEAFCVDAYWLNTTQEGTLPVITTYEKKLKLTPTHATIDDKEISVEGHTHTSADFETVLFSSDEGTSDAVALSETAANFTYLEIYFEGATAGSVKVYSPNGKSIGLQTQDGWETVAISDTSITRGDAPFKIYRVIGIK